MATARAALPLASLAEEAVGAISSRGAAVLVGEPGCGKSTQLPQLLLERLVAQGRGGEAAIVVTQPRRVAAVGLACRVAAERGEPVGLTCGYAVRGEVKAGPHTRILYCTVGWLLRQLEGVLSRRGEGWARLSRLSHVIVDEAHERSLLSDFLLAALRSALLEDEGMEEEGEDGGGEGVRSLPKLVAMSATIDATSFAAYLADGKGDAPVVRVPGRLFPVRCLHLEEVAAPALDEPTCMQHLALSSPPLPSPPPHATQVLAETRFGRGAARGGRDGMPAEVDWALLTHLVEHIATAGEPGAILVFLSGAREIERCCSALRSRPSLRGAWVRPLHGSLSPAEQRRAFEAPPPPTRKVVVSTNVAETSVTIGDVVHVVDCGLAKVTRYSEATRIGSLRDEPISLASAEQRRGRAGRVAPGHCYRLWAASAPLSPEQPPEMLRAPCDEVLLAACVLGAPSPAALLASALTPPPRDAIGFALDRLLERQAVERVEAARAFPPAGGRLPAGGGVTYRCTPLGGHLSSLPLDTRLGKMLLLAALTRCLDPLLTAAAALSLGASVFSAPRDRQQEASFLQREAYGQTRSDQLAAAAAYRGWCDARAAGKERGYCEARYLNARALRDLEAARGELLRHLASARFVKAPTAEGIAEASTFAGDDALLRGGLCAALYPNVAAATRTAPGSRAAQRTPYEKVTLPGGHRSGGDAQVWVHPSSINARPERAESGLYVYLDKVETSRLFLRETTRVSAAALLLFGATPAELDVERVKTCGRVELAGGVRVRASPQTVLLFKLLRRELDALLTRKARAPDAWPEEEPQGEVVLSTVRAVVAGC
mmetsp:Transcript_43696/g.140994  ORF Transcript_43696/g.140994 Transcript_43696/m.140994 type:complete len:829 (+) Transcript_43696:1-2487(+)